MFKKYFLLFSWTHYGSQSEIHDIIQYSSRDTITIDTMSSRIRPRLDDEYPAKEPVTYM